MSVIPMPACLATSAASALIARRTAAVRSRSLPGCIMTYETRLMRSSPKRICGFMVPAVASTLPLARSHRCIAIVVEPMSTAMP